MAAAEQVQARHHRHERAAHHHDDLHEDGDRRLRGGRAGTTSRWRSAARRSARCSPTKSAPTATARTPRRRWICSCGCAAAAAMDATWRRYKILYWQEIPSQIKAEDDAARRHAVDCSTQVHGAHRHAGARSAACRTPTTTWRNGSGATKKSATGSAAGSRRGGESGVGSEGRLVVAVGVNGSDAHHQRTHRRRRRRARRSSITPKRWACRCPPPASKQGKCKECIVEVVEGHGAALAAARSRSSISRATSASRASARVDRRRRRTSAATPCAAARCASSGMRLGLPASGKPMELDPAVTRDGDRILIDGVEIDRSTGPIHGIAMDLGTTTVVLRLINLETGELVADASFENPQRFGGSDVMSRIHYDTEHPRQAADAHAGRLSDATPSKSSRSIRRRSTKWWWSATRRCATCSSGRASTRSARVPTVDHRNRNGGGQAHDHQPDDDRPALPAADPSARRASTARRSSAATWARMRRRACWRSIWRTKSGWSRSWTSARTPS